MLFLTMYTDNFINYNKIFRFLKLRAYSLSSIHKKQRRFLQREEKIKKKFESSFTQELLVKNEKT